MCKHNIKKHEIYWWGYENIDKNYIAKKWFSYDNPLTNCDLCHLVITLRDHDNPAISRVYPKPFTVPKKQNPSNYLKTLFLSLDNPNKINRFKKILRRKSNE